MPLADAVFNVAHASTLMLGLATGNWELIAAGLDDRLHQPHRAHLYPRSAELLDRTARRELGGARRARSQAPGRTVLVVVPVRADGVVVEGADARSAGWADVIRAPFESQGADVRGL